MRLIDADALAAHFQAMKECANHRDYEYLMGVLSVVDREPTIDAVPVVRCPMCKHYEADCGYCDYWETSRRTDDYCSRGAKMDGGTE